MFSCSRSGTPRRTKSVHRFRRKPCKAPRSSRLNMRRNKPASASIRENGRALREMPQADLLPGVDHRSGRWFSSDLPVPVLQSVHLDKGSLRGAAQRIVRIDAGDAVRQAGAIIGVRAGSGNRSLRASTSLGTSPVCGAQGCGVRQQGRLSWLADTDTIRSSLR